MPKKKKTRGEREVIHTEVEDERIIFYREQLHRLFETARKYDVLFADVRNILDESRKGIDETSKHVKLALDEIIWEKQFADIDREIKYEISKSAWKNEILDEVKINDFLRDSMRASKSETEKDDYITEQAEDVVCLLEHIAQNKGRVKSYLCTLEDLINQRDSESEDEMWNKENYMCTRKNFALNQFKEKLGIIGKEFRQFILHHLSDDAQSNVFRTQQLEAVIKKTGESWLECIRNVGVYCNERLLLLRKTSLINNLIAKMMLVNENICKVHEVLTEKYNMLRSNNLRPISKEKRKQESSQEDKESIQHNLKAKYISKTKIPKDLQEEIDVLYDYSTETEDRDIESIGTIIRHLFVRFFELKVINIETNEALKSMYRLSDPLAANISLHKEKFTNIPVDEDSDHTAYIENDLRTFLL